MPWICAHVPLVVLPLDAHAAFADRCAQAAAEACGLMTQDVIVLVSGATMAASGSSGCLFVVAGQDRGTETERRLASTLRAVASAAVDMPPELIGVVRTLA